MVVRRISAKFRVMESSNSRNASAAGRTCAMSSGTNPSSSMVWNSSESCILCRKDTTDCCSPVTVTTSVRGSVSGYGEGLVEVVLVVGVEKVDEAKQPLCRLHSSISE